MVGVRRGEKAKDREDEGDDVGGDDVDHGTFGKVLSVADNDALEAPAAVSSFNDIPWTDIANDDDEDATLEVLLARGTECVIPLSTPLFVIITARLKLLVLEGWWEGYGCCCGGGLLLKLRCVGCSGVAACAGRREGVREGEGWFLVVSAVESVGFCWSEVAGWKNLQLVPFLQVPCM
jgi:hypothetical protein